jgi:hypothetical protein
MALARWADCRGVWGGNKAGCVSPMKPMLPIVRRQLPGFGASFGASFGPGAYWLQKAVA